MITNIQYYFNAVDYLIIYAHRRFHRDMTKNMKRETYILLHEICVEYTFKIYYQSTRSEQLYMIYI